MLAALLFAEMLALGANNDLLAVAASTFEIATAITVLLLVRPEEGFWREGWPIHLAVVVLLLIAATPGIAPLRALSPGIADAHRQWITPDLYGPEMARLYGGAALYLSSACIGYRRGLFRMLLGWLTLFCALDILIGLIMWQIDPTHVWNMTKRIHALRFTGTLLNANASGCLFGITSLLGLAHLQIALREPPATSGSWRQFLRAGSSGLVFLGGLGACAITQSRTALALTVLAITVMLITQVVGRGLTGPRRRIAAGIAVATLLFLGIYAGDTLERMATTGQASAERLEIWSHFIDYAKQTPAFGFGPLSFTALNTHRLGKPADAIGLWYINSAHNKPLALVIEHGWLFCALLLATVAAMAAAMIRFGRPQRTDPLPLAAFAALFDIIGCSMTDIALDVPVIAAFTIILWSGLWGRTLRLRADRQGRQDSARALLSSAV